MQRDYLKWGLLACALGPGATYAQSVEVYSGVPLIGTEGVPAVVNGSHGVLTALYDQSTNTLLYAFEWQFEAGIEATAAHFHGPAARGATAPIVVDLGPVSGNSGEVRGSVVLDDLQEADLQAGLWYLQIHSNANPPGEVRGQVVEFSPLDNSAVFDTATGRLRMETVMVPRIGVFDVEADQIPGAFPLAVEADSIVPADLSGSSGGDSP
jgi:hypothetical protein